MLLVGQLSDKQHSKGLYVSPQGVTLVGQPGDKQRPFTLLIYNHIRSMKTSLRKVLFVVASLLMSLGASAASTSKIMSPNGVLTVELRTGKG